MKEKTSNKMREKRIDIIMKFVVFCIYDVATL